MPFHPEIHHHATVAPDRLAFVIDGETRTYGELANRSRSFAAYLASLRGSREGQRVLSGVGKVVALALGNHIRFPELFIGSTEGPNACAVLDPKMPASQVEEILTRLRPDLIVTEEMNSSVAQIALKMGLEVRHAESFDHLAQGDRLAKANASDGAVDDTFLVSFTSGTTSLPKAYSRSRAAWRTSMSRGLSLFKLEDGPTTSCPGALAHGLALYALAETLHCGGTFHTVKQWRADSVANALSNGDIQRLVAVPTMISGLADSTQTKPLSTFPSIRDVLTAGSKLNGKQVLLMREMFPNARIMEYYGASELGFISVSTVSPLDAETPIHTVGKSFPGVEVSIRNSSGQLLGQGETGTIYVQSDLISDGYLWGDDGKAFRVDSSGAATVGDVGELDKNGALKVMGREGGMVISGGFNIYPSEVEAALRGIEGVDEAIVLGMEDDYLGMRLVAVLSGGFEDCKKVLEEASKTLPRYKVPREIFRASSWPMTTSGKIARGKFAEAVEKGQYAAVELSN